MKTCSQKIINAILEVSSNGLNLVDGQARIAAAASLGCTTVDISLIKDDPSANVGTLTHSSILIVDGNLKLIIGRSNYLHALEQGRKNIAVMILDPNPNRCY